MRAVSLLAALALGGLQSTDCSVGLKLGGLPLRAHVTPRRVRWGMSSTAQQPVELEGYGDSPPLLPRLSGEEELQLLEGRRVEHVVMPGGTTGMGLSVQDVKASPDDVFQALAQFEDYAKRISTVRDVTVYEQTGANTKALVEVSRFKLKLFVNFTTTAPARYIRWTLDRDRSTRFIRECVGYWRVEPIAARPGWSRVWFVVRVRLRPFVPSIVEGLVARVGLRRATKWIQDLAPRADGSSQQANAEQSQR